MSRRRKSRVSQKDLDMAAAGAKIAAGFWRRMGRITRLVLVGAIFAIILIAGGIYFYMTQPQVQQAIDQVTSNDEQQAGAVAREDITPVPGVASSSMGSGGAATTDWYELHFTAPEYPTKKENYK